MPSSIGVFAVARIIKRDTGEKISLWTPDRPFLTSVEVETGLSQNGLIKVTLEAPYPAGIALLEEPGLIVQSNILQVRLGYSRSGHMTPWYAGLMTTAGAEINPNGVSINIEAHGGAALAMTRQTQGQWIGTREAVLNQIAEKFGWDVEIDDPAGLKGAFNSTGANASVWIFLTSLLEKAGYNFYMGTSDAGTATLFVFRRESWVGLGAQRTFVMYGTIDLAKNQYPLLSFSAETSAVFLWQGSDGMKAVVMDDDGVEQTLEANSDTSTVPSLGADAGTSGATSATDPETKLTTDIVEDDQIGPMNVTLPSSSAETGDAQATLQAEYDSRQMASGFQITAESIGVPLMRPGEVVGVYGVSKLYEGLYGVFQVTHRVDSGGFSTSWVGRKNAFPDGSGTGLKVATPENTQTEPASPGEAT